MANRSVPTIACGLDHNLCINKDDLVSSFGYSECNAHGDEAELVFPPRLIPLMKNIKAVTVGSCHSACLDYSGNVFTFGSNEYGQLGIGKDNTELFCTPIPQKVNLPPCKEVSCGVYYTICLLRNGDLYSFGYNLNGELGLGSNNYIHNVPQKILSLEDVELVECGSNYTFCKTINNEIFTWGYNEHGSLGLGNFDNHRIPIQNLLLTNIEIVDIKCGYLHTLLLTSNLEVLSCGNNLEGQLGREITGENASTFQKIPTLSEITRIECGSFQSMCINAYNDLYVFGFNSNGELGLSDNNHRFKPVKHPLSNIIDISKGGDHTFVKTSKNEIYAFGCSSKSQLGIQTNQNNHSTPIRVFEDNEDIWFSNINKSKAKSARF